MTDQHQPTMTDADAANIIATGALYALLQTAARTYPALASITLPNDAEPTNQIHVTFSFLKSPYRLTVERIPDGDTQPERAESPVTGRYRTDIGSEYHVHADAYGLTAEET